MFWPVVLPFQITIALLAVFVFASTAFAPTIKWKPSRMFAISLGIGCMAFVPSCVIIETVIDSQRFGTFQYASASEVNDFRVERYLPPRATNITLKKNGSGYCAKYTISKADLVSYLDAVWGTYGKLSTTPRDRLRNGVEIPQGFHDSRLADSNWTMISNPIVFDSPDQGNGAGATYYFDPATDTVHQVADYW